MTVPKRFDVLRFMGAMFKVFAWITLILTILTAIGVVLLPQIAGLSEALGPYAGLCRGSGRQRYHHWIAGFAGRAAEFRDALCIGRDYIAANCRGRKHAPDRCVAPENASG